MKKLLLIIILVVALVFAFKTNIFSNIFGRLNPEEASAAVLKTSLATGTVNSAALTTQINPITGSTTSITATFTVVVKVGSKGFITIPNNQADVALYTGNNTVVAATSSVISSTFTKGSQVATGWRIPANTTATGTVTAVFYPATQHLASGVYIAVIKSLKLTNGYSIVFGKNTTNSITLISDSGPTNPSSITVSLDGSSPASQNITVSSSDGARSVSMVAAKVVSPVATSINSVSIQGFTTGAVPTAVYLYDGTTLVASAAYTDTLTFNNLGISLAANTNKILNIKADFPPTVGNGSSARITVTGVGYTKTDGTRGSISASVAGNAQYFYSAQPVFTLLSALANAATNGLTGSTTYITGTFTIRVRPIGGAMKVPTASDFVIKATTGATSLIVPDGNKNIVINPTPVPSSANSNTPVLSEGTDYTITISGSMFNTALSQSGSYTFSIPSIAWTIGSVSSTQTVGLESYVTTPVTFVK